MGEKRRGIGRKAGEVVGVREAGVYKCEITYLTSSPCPVVRLISRLVVISPPTSVDLFLTRPQVRVTNSTTDHYRPALPSLLLLLTENVSVVEGEEEFEQSHHHRDLNPRH